MVYAPSPSVTAVRVFSISEGLEADTVTPARPAPVASFTLPEIVALWLCTTIASGRAAAIPGWSRTAHETRNHARMGTLSNGSPLSGNASVYVQKQLDVDSR